MKFITYPSALLRAQRLIFRDIKRTAAIHEIRIEKATEPDQYRVLFRLPRHGEDEPPHALVPRIIATEAEAQAVEDWLAARYPGGRPW